MDLTELTLLKLEIESSDKFGGKASILRKLRNRINFCNMYKTSPREREMFYNATIKELEAAGGRIQSSTKTEN